MSCYSCGDDSNNTIENYDNVNNNQSREGWYARAGGGQYELNLYGPQSGQGPAWGPKHNINIQNLLNPKTIICVLVCLIVLLLLLNFFKIINL